MGQLKFGPSKGEPSKSQAILNKSIWLFGTSRNAIVVIICGFIGSAVYDGNHSPLTLIGDVPAGLPSVKMPPFGGYTVNLDNNTKIEVSFSEIVSNLGTGIIVTPLIGLLETIAICKAFGKLYFFYDYLIICLLFTKFEYYSLPVSNESLLCPIQLSHKVHQSTKFYLYEYFVTW